MLRILGAGTVRSSIAIGKYNGQTNKTAYGVVRDEYEGGWHLFCGQVIDPRIVNAKTRMWGKQRSAAHTRKGVLHESAGKAHEDRNNRSERRFRGMESDARTLS